MSATTDEDDEFDLEALQRELESVQAEVSVQKLSERNCIEIVNTLCELGEIDLIYTQDGQEYLTHERLEEEVRDELLAAGGASV